MQHSQQAAGLYWWSGSDTLLLGSKQQLVGAVWFSTHDTQASTHCWIVTFEMELNTAL